ncbi:MAG: hypothetical protein FWC75_07105 [Oscillospiraceae bacterium]|nr:hypothetical protein [Oscillospiraceae bacterium]
MKLLFVQIGDMHICYGEKFSETKLQKFCDVLNIHSSVDEVFLLVCGDLTNSGNEGEYSATKRILG